MLGEGYLAQNTYFMATEVLFKAYQIFQQNKLDSLVAISLLKITNAYIKQEIEEIAIEKLKLAKEIFKKLNSKKGLTQVYILMAQAVSNSEPAQALLYLKNAKKSAINSNQIGQIYFLFAKNYEQLGMLDSSLYFLNKAFIEFHKANDKIKMSESFLCPNLY